jgi:hypothetical protein
VHCGQGGEDPPRCVETVRRGQGGLDVAKNNPPPHIEMVCGHILMWQGEAGDPQPFSQREKTH